MLNVMRVFSLKLSVNCPKLVLCCCNNNNNTLVGRNFFWLEIHFDLKILIPKIHSVVSSWTRPSNSYCSRDITSLSRKEAFSPTTLFEIFKSVSMISLPHHFPYFLPSPFLTCCAILPTSFGGKGPHLRRWLVAQPLHQTVSKLRFSGVFLSPKVNARRSMHSPQDYFIITLIISDRRDWRDSRGT